MDLPEGFELAAVLEREDPRDAFVSTRYASIEALPHGAIVGTSSLRRIVQLLALRPDLVIEPLRGNLDTRLRKLDEGGFDAIVLAAAGLKRLGLATRIRAFFEASAMLPCAGQGALGIEVRSDARGLREQLAELIHRPTWFAVQAERAVSRALGGSCSMPLAAYGQWAGDKLDLQVALGHALTPGAPLLRPACRGAVKSDAEALALGDAAAAPCARSAARLISRRRTERVASALLTLVTRPQAQADEWVRRLRAHGLQAASLPLIGIAPVVDAAPLLAAWQGLGSYALVVSVSPNAVAQFFAARPAGVAWPATLAGSPGPGTSEALRSLGVPADRIVEPAAEAVQFDSESLWVELSRHEWRGSEVLLVRGDGGRDWLATQLQQRGARVTPLTAYGRCAPSFDAAQQALLAHALAAPGERLWFFSSSEAIDHLAHATASIESPRWAETRALATHPRIAARARQLGIGHVIEARPTLDAVVACIQSMRP